MQIPVLCPTRRIYQADEGGHEQDPVASGFQLPASKPLWQKERWSQDGGGVGGGGSVSGRGCCTKDLESCVDGVLASGEVR